MSANFLKYKRYYDEGTFTKERLRQLVGKRLGITAAEYELITGEPYEE